MPESRASLRAYRLVLKLYPASFRESYEGEMEREFRDELAETRGLAGLAALWFRLLLDVAFSVPAQFVRELWQDSRHAMRQWTRRPLYAAFAVSALAIGIGANIGMFSVVDALLLRPLPFRDPDRLVGLYLFQPPHDSSSRFHEWRRTSAYLEDAALMEQADVNLDGGREAVRTRLIQTSSNFFSFLGTAPLLGRGFSPEEDQPGRNNVVVVSYGFWQSFLGGDPKALGGPLRIDGVPVTIVGIAPPGFDFPQGAALWRPADFRPANNGWTTIARLRPGVSLRQARPVFLAEADRLAPNRRREDKIARPAVILPLQAGLSSDPGAPPHSPPSARTGSLILLAGAALILLIACANVANLLLARTAERTGELSVRSALGAGRARLAQQLLTECLLLALLASIAGLGVAHWAIAIAAKVQPPPIGQQSYSIFDARVAGFTIAISILCGLLFGMLPSLFGARVHSFALRGSNSRTSSSRTRALLVSAQVALTLLLLTSSLSLNRAFRAFAGMDRGFSRQGVMTVSVALAGTAHDQPGARLPYLEQVLDRVRAIPGVRSASSTEFLPLAETGFMGGPFSLDGRPASEFSMLVPVLPRYLETIGARLIAGREFTESDLHSTVPIAMVNDVFAQQFGDPADAVGHQLRAGRAVWTVAGVFKAMVYLGDYNHLQVLVPDRTPGPFPPAFVVRSEGRAEDYLAIVRDTVKSVDAQVPVFDVKSMDQRLGEALVRPRFYSIASNFFAGFALLLAVIGVYGVVAFSVAQRAHEMGVKLALGTTPGRLRIALLQQTFAAVGVGAAVGIGAAVPAGKLIENLVDYATPAGLWTSLGAALIIAASAAIAVYGATRRVARLDIMEVLRSE